MHQAWLEQPAAFLLKPANHLQFHRVLVVLDEPELALAEQILVTGRMVRLLSREADLRPVLDAALHGQCAEAEAERETRPLSRQRVHDSVAALRLAGTGLRDDHAEETVAILQALIGNRALRGFLPSEEPAGAFAERCWPALDAWPLVPQEGADGGATQAHHAKQVILERDERGGLRVHDPGARLIMLGAPVARSALKGRLRVVGQHQGGARGVEGQ